MLGHAQRYRYPHDDPAGVVTQQYPPDELRERRYYEPTTRGAERVLAERAATLRAIVRGEPRPGPAAELGDSANG
jgi:putative ATPase